MKKVITYGTYDLLHQGHINLLRRAKELGDYLIVGVTSDDFDRKRGKINVQQSLVQRIESVRNLNIADEIIVEEYEGQKIDDIKKYGIDIFTVGSDWVGKFDYLNEYCKVIYLERTKNISSSELRALDNKIKIGIVGESHIAKKFYNESKFVNGANVVAYHNDYSGENIFKNEDIEYFNNYENMLDNVDAVYVISHPSKHYQHSMIALKKGKHVICESPVSLYEKECLELYKLAEKNKCTFLEGIKTAYSTAYERMILLAKSGCIGNVVSIDATCTSLSIDAERENSGIMQNMWNSICDWGPTALLPVFQLFGNNYLDFNIYSKLMEGSENFDVFSKIDFHYNNCVATLKIGNGVKSEGELIISGTKGYIYIPAPWWKTDYFEVRYEDIRNTKRYFYQLDREGIENEILVFLKRIKHQKTFFKSEKEISLAICKIIENFYNKNRKTI